MWGCGPSHILEEQVKQKKWEKKEAEKQSTKKVNKNIGERDFLNYSIMKVESVIICML